MDLKEFGLDEMFTQKQSELWVDVVGKICAMNFERSSKEKSILTYKELEIASAFYRFFRQRSYINCAGLHKFVLNCEHFAHEITILRRHKTADQANFSNINIVIKSSLVRLIDLISRAMLVSLIDGEKRSF